MKLILIIIPFCICSLSEIAVPETAKQACAVQLLSDSIKWSPDYKLNVGDFMKSTIGSTTAQYDSSKYSLLAYSSVALGYIFKSEKGKLIFEPFALFIRSRSWMKSPDEAVLKHEQGHFDITEIYARKLKQAVGEINNIENRSFWASFQKTYQEINGLHLKEQANYDEMTITSLGQDYYYKKILDDLKATE